MVDLVDVHGRPIRRHELESPPQTADVAYLRREFGNHPSRGLTPSRLARILESAEHGDLVDQAQLGEDMEEKDAHLFAELSKRRSAILGLSWYLAPPADPTDQERVETKRIETLIRAMDWESVVYDASAAILHGYACSEYEWERSDNEWRLRTVTYRQPDWFMTTLEDRNRLMLRTPDGLGDPLRPWGWLVHTHKAKSGYLVRSGLSRILAWPFLFRNYAARDLAEFLEIYGLPLRLGKYPAGASDEEKATLMRAVVNIGHAAAGIIPQGMALEFEEAAQGASDPFMAMIRWAEASISKAILGGTLTSQTSEGGGGAYALGNVHNEVRHDILVSDAQQLARSLSLQLVAPLVYLNTRMTRLPNWMFETEQAQDVLVYSQALPALVNIGMEIPERWAHEKLRIPAPEGDERILKSQPQAQPLGFTALKSATPSPPQPAHTPVDMIVPRLERENQRGMADWLERIESMLTAANSFTEFKTILLSAQQELPDAALGDALSAALISAEAAGRYDAEHTDG